MCMYMYRYSIQQTTIIHVPVLAGNEALWSIFGMVTHQSGLPPFVISNVENVQDVSVGEGQALGWAVVVLAGIILK